MKTAVILPTYNEKENVEKIIQHIFDLKIIDLEIVVVDDNSPDGTADIVEKCQTVNSSLHLIRRKGKLGLGTAYLEGFRYALEKGADYFFEIDADFSHDPKDISLFLSRVNQCDLVIGSRYIANGKISNWNASRRFVSSFGNLYARFILKMAINDLTTGYKCYRREVVEYLLGKEIDAVGYVFQIETTYHAVKRGFRVEEIPIVFTERTLGKSKFSLAIVGESFWKVLKLRFADKKSRKK